MKIVLSASIVILTTLLSNAQTTPAPSSHEFAYKILAETPHRVTMTVEMRDTAESAWEPYSSQTKEVIGRDRWHLIQHTGLKQELIGLDDRIYQKMPDGGWQLRPPGGGYTGPTVTQVSRPTAGFGSVREKLDGTTTVVETRSTSTLQVNGTGEAVYMDRKTKESFDESGRLIRVESEFFNFERKKFQRSIEVYDYDPTIRIEAPIK